MKQGKQLLILLVLVAVAAGVWYFRTRESRVVASNGILTVQNLKLLDMDDIGVHWDVLNRARSAEYHGSGRNPFSAEAPVARVNASKPAASRPNIGPAPPAPAPPVQWPANLQFFGYGTVPNSPLRRAFIRDGEDVYIFGEGDTVLGRYRIVKINNTNLEFEELSTGRRASTPLIEEQGGLQQNPS